MSLRQYRETTLIECARDARTASNTGSNNLWRNDLAQSLRVEPGDSINVEAAMVQSGIGDDQIELLGDTDTKAAMHFGFYVANDWVFSAPLPLYDSKVLSEFITPASSTQNQQRYAATYGELDFSGSDPTVNTPAQGVEHTRVNASKNLGPSYERLYIGDDEFEGLYTPTENVWKMQQSTTQFDIPKGFHTPAALAQLMTNALHDIGGTCAEASHGANFQSPYVRVQGNPLTLRYNLTDSVSKTFATSAGQELFLRQKLTPGVWDSLDAETRAKRVFYANLATTEPARMSAIGKLHTPLTLANSFYATTGALGPTKDLYSGLRYAGANTAMLEGVGNFGLQIVVNDFLKTAYPVSDVLKVLPAFPHRRFMEPMTNAADINVNDTHAYLQGQLDLQEGDVLYTNLVATAANFDMLTATLKMLAGPDADGDSVAAIDLGRADDFRCWSSRSDRMGSTPNIESNRQAEIAAFTLLSPPISQFACNYDASDAAHNKNRYTNTPLHYGYGPSQYVPDSQMMLSNVVLQPPPLSQDAYYTSSEVDSEWGYRVNVFTGAVPSRVQIHADTTHNDSYKVHKAPGAAALGPTPNLLDGDGRLIFQGLQDATWRHTSQGVDNGGHPYAPTYNKLPVVDGLQNILSADAGKHAFFEFYSTTDGHTSDYPYAMGFQIIFRHPTTFTDMTIQRAAGSHVWPTDLAVYGGHTPFSWQTHDSTHDQARVVKDGVTQPINGTPNIARWNLSANSWNPANNAASIPNASAHQYFTHYLVRILDTNGRVRSPKLLQCIIANLVFSGVRTSLPIPAGAPMTGCMGPNNSQERPFSALKIPPGLVVGYRQRQVYHSGYADSTDPTLQQTDQEPAALMDIPFIGLVYKNQRVTNIPTPSIGEMIGISRSFADLKCAKLISSQKDGPAGGTAGNAIYNEAGLNHVTTLNVGAANAQFNYNETLNRITLNDLHTQMRLGQTEHNFNQNITHGTATLPGAPDLVQRLHFQTTVCFDSTTADFKVVGRSRPWGLMSAQSGVGILGIDNAVGPVTSGNEDSQWEDSLWAKLGYTLEDLLPLYQNPQLLYNSIKYNSARNSSLAYEKFMNQCSPLTTNGLVSTDQMVSLVTNQSNLPLFLAPGSVRDLGPASLTQVADYIIPKNAPSRYSYSHLVVYSDIVQSGNYIGCNKNSSIPAVAYVTKSFVTGNFIYGQESPLVFTVDRPYQISDILIDIRLPDGRPANLDPNSTVIFRVVKNKVSLDMTPAQYTQIKKRRRKK